MKEIVIGVSCSGSGTKRWRTELELGSGKSLEDHHGTATFGTDPKRVRFPGRGFWFGARWLYCVESVKAKRQKSRASTVGEEPKVANADKAFG